MSQPTDIDARRYWRVAYQRLDDGRLMLERLDRRNAAVYLAGYAVECILKALIVTSTPARDRSAATTSFRGAGGHDLLRLRQRLAGDRGVHIPPRLAQSFSLVVSWSVDLRDEPGPGDRDDAEAFIAAARAIVAWADGRI
jgi:HEPN domain-containing protein